MNKESIKYNNKKGTLEVDLNVWMRPKEMIDFMKKKGVVISHQKLRYWYENGHIEKVVIKHLGDLVLVNIHTSPFGDMR